MVRAIKEGLLLFVVYLGHGSISAPEQRYQGDDDGDQDGSRHDHRGEARVEENRARSPQRRDAHPAHALARGSEAIRERMDRKATGKVVVVM